MAHSRYQQGVVKRYYENRDTMSLQNLGEIASDLFLCEDPKAAAKLWERVAKALRHTQADQASVEKILTARDVAGLTRLVNELTAPGLRGSNPSASAASSPTTQAPASPAPVTSGSPKPAGAPQPPAAQEPLDPADPQVQKRALKAFRKRLKLTRLDEESKLGRSPLTSGRGSGVVAITPPNQYPPAVWEELVSQGKLKRSGTGFYALVE